MASKPKYNPDDVDHWVTVKGARIPVMKDGTFGVGTKESSVSSDAIKKKMYNVNSAVQQAREAKDWKTYREATEEYNRLSNILKETQESEKIVSRNAKYDTSRTKNNSNPLKPRIQKKAGLVFAVSAEGNVLKTWKESEFTEKKYENYLKKLDKSNPNNK